MGREDDPGRRIRGRVFCEAGQKGQRQEPRPHHWSQGRVPVDAIRIISICRDLADQLWSSREPLRAAGYERRYGAWRPIPPTGTRAEPVGPKAAEKRVDNHSHVAQAALVDGKADAKCLAEAVRTLPPGFNHADYTFIGGTEGNDFVFLNEGTFYGQAGDDIVNINTILGTFYGGASLALCKTGASISFLGMGMTPVPIAVAIAPGGGRPWRGRCRGRGRRRGC